MGYWDDVLAIDNRELLEAKTRRDAARAYSQEHRRWTHEVEYLERKRAKHIRERDREARDSETERARAELRAAKADARAAQTRAREISRYLPTGAQIRDAARLRVTPSRNRNHAHGARKRRLLAIARRITRAEELGAAPRQIEWARTCVQMALDMRPARVEMGTDLVFPYLQCGVCGRVNCDHPLELAAERPAPRGIPVVMVPPPASVPAVPFAPPPAVPRAPTGTGPAFPWMAPPPKEK